MALGYYFSSDRDARRSGTLPRPLAQVDALPPGMLQWDGYGGNIAPLTDAARAAGFFKADPFVLRRFLTGALSWTTTWFRPSGKMTLDQLAEEALALVFKES